MPHQKTKTYIDFISDDDETLKIEGYLDVPGASVQDITIDVSGESVTPIGALRPKPDNATSAGVTAFRAQLKINKTRKLKLTAKYQGQNLRIETNRFSGLANLLLSYRKLNGLVLVSYAGTIRIYPKTKKLIFILEFLTQLSIIFNLRIKDSYRKFINAVGPKNKMIRLLIGVAAAMESVAKIPQALLLRWAYFLSKLYKKRPIWIISDRVTAAGDNGEALFRHIATKNNHDVEVYFSISRKSKDFKKLSSVGKTLNYGSLKHKLYFLLADKIISSHADTEVTNPFFRQIDRYLDLFHFDFIFLQHGVIRHDLSAWLNRFEKNIALFITSSSKERELILSHPYYYSEEQVVVAGLPRHDRLVDKPQRKIVVAPTYRNFLVNSRPNKQGERGYDKTFKKSRYFDFYNNFIKSPELAKLMKQHSVTGEFYLHPVFKSQGSDFAGNDVFRVMKYPYDYVKAITEGAMLVSDHSSIVFDFAYLKKPVLYAHFDADEFYEGHSFAKPESFDEQSNGFGEICHDLESLIKHTKDLIETGFEMSPEYKKRADSYFDFHDKHNSDRVYRAILNLGKGSNS